MGVGTPWSVEASGAACAASGAIAASGAACTAPSWGAAAAACGGSSPSTPTVPAGTWPAFWMGVAWSGDAWAISASTAISRAAWGVPGSSRPTTSAETRTASTTAATEAAPGVDPLGHAQGCKCPRGCRLDRRRSGHGKAAGHGFHRKLLEQGYGGLKLFQLFSADGAGGQLLVHARPGNGTQPAVHILGKGFGPKMSVTASKCPHGSTHLDESGMVRVPRRLAKCPEVPFYRGSCAISPCPMNTPSPARLPHSSFPEHPPASGTSVGRGAGSPDRLEWPGLARGVRRSPPETPPGRQIRGGGDGRRFHVIDRERVQRHRGPGPSRTQHVPAGVGDDSHQPGLEVIAPELVESPVPGDQALLHRVFGQGPVVEHTARQVIGLGLEGLNDAVVALGAARAVLDRQR